MTVQGKPSRLIKQRDLSPLPSRGAGAQGAAARQDRQVWRRIDARLTALRQAGARRVRVLDAGSGTATWLWRIADRAAALGFEAISLQSLHKDPATIALIKAVLAEQRSPAIRLCAERRDIAKPLPFQDRAFDLCLCVDTALNHVTPAARSRTAAELCRVTSGLLVVTVQSVGGPQASSRQCPQHLFDCESLRAAFAPHLASVAIAGLDLFGGRFAAGGPGCETLLKTQEGFAEKLDWLEQTYASDPDFIDRAACIMLTGETTGETIAETTGEMIGETTGGTTGGTTRDMTGRAGARTPRPRQKAGAQAAQFSWVLVNGGGAHQG